VQEIEAAIRNLSSAERENLTSPSFFRSWTAMLPGKDLSMMLVRALH
jgi:hypothetical protein